MNTDRKTENNNIKTDNIRPDDIKADNINTHTIKSDAAHKKKINAANKWVRLGIQIIFFIMMPGSFVAGFSGVKYIFQQIGTGQPLAWNSFLFTLIGLCVFTVIFGRFFCGYVCAFGTLGDLIFLLSSFIQDKILRRHPGKVKTVIVSGRKVLKFPEKLTKILQILKYVILAAIIILCALGIYSSLGGWSPWTEFSFFMALRPRITGYVPGFILLILIIIGMAFKERFFCQFLCPLGALFSLLPQLPIGFFRRDPDKCITGCNACKMQCPVEIKLEQDGFRNGQCIGCDRCAGVCPKSNLTRWDLRLFRYNFIAALVKAALFFVMGAFLGLCRFI